MQQSIFSKNNGVFNNNNTGKMMNQMMIINSFNDKSQNNDYRRDIKKSQYNKIMNMI